MLWTAAGILLSEKAGIKQPSTVLPVAFSLAFEDGGFGSRLAC